MIFAKTDIDKILEIIKKESTERYIFTFNNKRNTSWISKQPLF